MAWKATGQPTVRKQRDKWVVRVDGIDTETGKHRPRQVGTYTSQRSATAAARSFRAEETTTERGTVSWLVRRSGCKTRSLSVCTCSWGSLKDFERPSTTRAGAGAEADTTGGGYEACA